MAHRGQVQRPTRVVSDAARIPPAVGIRFDGRQARLVRQAPRPLRAKATLLALAAISLAQPARSAVDASAGIDPGAAAARYIANIAKLDDAAKGPRLNAVIVYNPKAAAEARAKARTGLLRGRTVLVKDNIETREWPTTAGSLALADNRTGRDAPLITRLRAVWPEILLVHRLDCDTSGVMIFARTKAAQGFLGQEFEKRRARKTYIARVMGRMDLDSGHVDLPLCADWPNRPRQHVDMVNGRSAQTDWEVIGRSGVETRVLMRPLTGRSHQLRVHMLSLGHPILGDPIYATGDALAFPRMMLHAASLSLHHPADRTRVSYAADCPF